MMSALNDLKPRLELAFDFAARQLAHTLQAYPDRFPMYTQGGRWHLSGEAWTNWCEGFLGGQLWLIYLHNRDPYWKVQAERASRLIEDRRQDGNVHDLGFLFWSTYKPWFDVSGDPLQDAVLIEAGRTLATRYQPAGGYIASFMGFESLFIDIMMNVHLIFYAAQRSGDRALWEIARRHVDTTRRTLIRGDGSTAHEGLFERSTGAFLRQNTQQGWRPDSCWARGQAWALYGFGTVYRLTQDRRDLASAEQCAAYWLDNMPEHGVPPNDFDEPEPALPYESSAAAIAAGGLWQLATLTGDSVRSGAYREAAIRTMFTLTGPEFLAYETSGWEGLLKHGIYHQIKGLGVDESVMWGDYFFLHTAQQMLGG